jgi:hypothetical protein
VTRSIKKKRGPSQGPTRGPGEFSLAGSPTHLPYLSSTNGRRGPCSHSVKRAPNPQEQGRTTTLRRNPQQVTRLKSPAPTAPVPRPFPASDPRDDLTRWVRTSGTLNLGGDGVCGACQGAVAIHSVVLSGCRGQTDDLVPGGKAGGHLTAVFLGTQTVVSGPEVR